jgi:regulator of replication initiation timing
MAGTLPDVQCRCCVSGREVLRRGVFADERDEAMKLTPRSDSIIATAAQLEHLQRELAARDVEVARLRAECTERDARLVELETHIADVADDICGLQPVQKGSELLGAIGDTATRDRIENERLRARLARVEPVFDAAKAWHAMMRTPARDDMALADYHADDEIVHRLVLAIDSALAASQKETPR